jgi:hypothetical protein
MHDDPVCVDPTTGQVLEITRQGTVLFVNSSIAAFTETVRAVLERFPYYDEDAEFDEIHAVARDLADLIHGINPEAMADDGFWSTFVDDVEMGDFATQADEYQPGGYDQALASFTNTPSPPTAPLGDVRTPLAYPRSYEIGQ